MEKNPKKDFYHQPVPVLHSRDFVMVVCSNKHTFFITITGLPMAAGTSEAGELGCYSDKTQYVIDSPQPVHGLKRVSDLSTSPEHTLAIDYESGQIYGWGNPQNGRLSIDTTNVACINSPTPVHVHKLKDGSVPSFRMVACSGNFSLAIDTIGSLWFTGTNYSDNKFNIEGKGNIT